MKTLQLPTLFMSAIAGVFLFGCYSSNEVKWSLTRDVLPPIVPGQETGLMWMGGALSANVNLTATWTPSISSILAGQRIQLHVGAGCMSPVNAPVDLPPVMGSHTFLGVNGLIYSFSVSSLNSGGSVISSSCSGVLTVDTSAPVLSFVSVTNPSPTNSTSFALAYGAITEAYAEHCILENSTDVNLCVWSVSALPSSFVVTPTQGAKILSVWLKDAAGNISSRVDSDPVTLDTVTPSLGSATITNSSPTNTTTYNLSYGTVTDTYSEYCILENPGAGDTCVGWNSGTLPSTFTVTAVDGSKILKIWLRDEAGNTSAGVTTNSVTLQLVAPLLSWSATAYDFGSVTKGTSSHSYTLTLTNTGGNAASCAAPAIDNSTDFSIVPGSDTCGTANLAAGGSCSLRIQSTPAAAAVIGVKTVVVARTCSLPTPVTVQTGTGVTTTRIRFTAADSAPLLRWSRSNADFGSVYTGGYSFTQLFIFRNEGSAPSSICGAPGLVGTNPAEFEIVSGPDSCSSGALAAGAQCSVYVRAKPGSAGAKSATLTRTCGAVTPTAPTLSVVGTVGTPVEISAQGNGHSCARLSDGTIRCWGRNGYGQLGTGDYLERRVPASVVGITDAIAITTGEYHSCAILNDKTVKCWGSSSSIGTGGSSSSIPVSVPGLSNVDGIDSGAGHTCARTGDGSVWCWGGNSRGQLGDGTKVTSLTPIQANISDVAEIEAGYTHTCARLNDGTVWCWGYQFGGMGNGTNLETLTPVQVTGIANAVALTSSHGHTCALLFDGSVKCWGNGGNGQIGTSKATFSFPQSVSLPDTVVSISAALKQTCAVLTNSDTYCWGGNEEGQLGTGDRTERITPVKVPAIPPAIAVTAADTHTCVLLQSNAGMRCWGGNLYGQLGDGTSLTHDLPSLISGISGATKVVVGGEHVCALLSDQTVQCWGGNSDAQLGVAGVARSHLPVTVPGLSSVLDLAAGRGHTCALLSGGTVRCWGYNGYSGGVLGGGLSSYSSASPVTVTLADTALSISAGAMHTCAALTDGRVQCWGGNGSGRLGDGTETTRPSPVFASGIANAIQVALGHQHSCALLSDQSVRCWGYNYSGAVGNGTSSASTGVLIPAQVLNLGFVTRISAANETSCARISDGSLRCWGFRTGDGTGFGRTMPVSVLGISSASSVSVGYDFSCTVLNSGEVRCWGDNAFGSLGIGIQLPPSNQSTPLTALNSVSSIATSSSGDLNLRKGKNACALRTDGTVYCWGPNDEGQVGFNELQIRTVSGF